MRRPRAVPPHVDVLAERDILVTELAAPVLLRPGSPARGAGCLVCGEVIGAGLASALCLLPGDGMPGAAGSVPCAAWWAHHGCLPIDADRALKLATGRVMLERAARDGGA